MIIKKLYVKLCELYNDPYFNKSRNLITIALLIVVFIGLPSSDLVFDTNLYRFIDFEKERLFEAFIFYTFFYYLVARILSFPITLICPYEKINID